MTGEETARTGPVDSLPGAEVYPFIILDGLRKGGEYEPIVRQIISGWVLTDPIPGPIYRLALIATFRHLCGITNLCLAY